jgi:hypothetical protein
MPFLAFRRQFALRTNSKEWLQPASCRPGRCHTNRVNDAYPPVPTLRQKQPLPLRAFRWPDHQTRRRGILQPREPGRKLIPQKQDRITVPPSQSSPKAGGIRRLTLPQKPQGRAGHFKRLRHLGPVRIKAYKVFFAFLSGLADYCFIFGHVKTGVM